MKQLKLTAIAMAACALAACGTSTTREYANSDLVLGPAHAAHDACACLFVMNMPDDYCLSYTKVTPDIFRYSVDKTRKTVEASALVMWGARAHWVNQQEGCLLE